MRVDRRHREPELELFEVHPLSGTSSDYDSLVERATRARFVLVGEASHGTQESHRERAEITQRLVTEAGFTAVAVDADWPHAHRVNEFVQARNGGSSPREALSGFRTFPAWTWRNADVAEFVAWLRGWNDALPAGRPKTGFYGLDLYSLHESMDAVVRYLEDADADAAQRARERYGCFDHFGKDPQVHACDAGGGGAEPCERQAVEQLVELQRRREPPASRRNGQIDPDRHFFAEQNARLVANAQRHYRAVFRGGPQGWNLHNRHMFEMLESLTAHLERAQGRTKVVVWGHNSHLGKARATEMTQRSEPNVGQLVRERHGAEALLVGFTTYEGTVTAASRWGGAAERKRVRPALHGSWEELFHRAGDPRFLLETDGLRGPRLERAIGAVYLPQTERFSHYFRARLADQFDAVIHIDRTHAVEPLERTSEWDAAELIETYPWGV
jgi:erythromycin esterase-like protein